jgi:putative CocE/NonD family hydrolase
MRRRREVPAWSKISVLGGAVLLAASVTAPSVASASPRPKYVTNAGDPTTPYKETANVPITMSDGTILESDVYVPTTCTDKSRCPVILIQTPYRKGNSTTPSDFESSSDETMPYLYEHGYIEVVVDVRGTGSSEGYWDSFGPREQQDGAELVQWVSNPSHLPTNGVVGLAGVSYAGINQLLTVEAVNRDIAGRGPLTDPGAGCTTSSTFDCGNPTHITRDPVKAIVPIVAMSDSYRDVTFAGGNVDSGFIPLWLGLVDSLGLQPPDETQSDPAVALNAESQHIEDLYRFSASAVADSSLGSYETLLPEELQTYPQQAYDGPFYTQRSPITDIGEVNVPTFLIGGTYDLFQRGEPILYNALRLPSSEKKLVIGPWYHVTEGTGLPANDTSGNTIPSDDNIMLGWFDRWLKGKSNGIQSFPTVETYRLGAGRWVPNTQYPAKGTTGQRWYLGSGNALSTSGSPTSSSAELPAVTATGACSRSTWQWTAGLPAEAGTSPGCENGSTATQAQGLTFTTAPFTSAYTINGPIEADVYMSSTASDSSVVATVSDVSPSGTGGSSTASDVTAGTLVASLREVDPAPCRSVVLDCSVYLDGQSIQPWHPYTQASQIPLQAGRIYELRMEIFPTSATFEPGHEMRVTITTSDIPHESQSLSTMTGSTGIDTFYFGGNTPSSIYLGTTTPVKPRPHAG